MSSPCIPKVLHALRVVAWLLSVKATGQGESTCAQFFARLVHQLAHCRHQRAAFLEDGQVVLVAEAFLQLAQLRLAGVTAPDTFEQADLIPVVLHSLAQGMKGL